MSGPEETKSLYWSLGKLSRGLTGLFWALPLSLVIMVRTATKSRLDLEPSDFFPSVILSGALCYSIFQLRFFRPNERVWRVALDRCGIFGVALFGFSPFIYFNVRFPLVWHFSACVGLAALSGIALLFTLNQVMARLAAMLPDQTLRAEVRLFGQLNQWSLVALPALAALGLTVLEWGLLPPQWVNLFQESQFLTLWPLLFLTLLPLAITMALLHKTREVVFTGLFGTRQIESVE